MSGPQLFETRMGQRFYDSTMPRIAAALESIAKSLQVLATQPQQQQPPALDVTAAFDVMDTAKRLRALTDADLLTFMRTPQPHNPTVNVAAIVLQELQRRGLVPPGTIYDPADPTAPLQGGADPDVCPHCDSRNTADLTATEHECHDCGRTYTVEPTR